MEETKTNIEKILAERMKLDEILKSEFTRKITVMFTDIKGSTSFYEQRGDLDGRLMVHRHNEIVMPVIEENKGKLIKTIGDATMSVYNDPVDGVRAAMEIQRRLKDYNTGRPKGELISVRIGLNTGLGIVEDKDVFGDVVNVASRVESLADGGEIMVTEDTYREVKSHDEFIFRYAEAAKVKGKAEALKAYRLVWQEEDLHIGVVRRASSPAARAKTGVFVLEASVAGGQIKVSAYERTGGEERAVKNYSEIAYHAEKVGEHTKAITDVLNRANRRGKIGSDLIVKLKELGGLLFDELVPVEFKEKIKRTGESNLMLNIDDRLVHIPWELLYDGRDFLCQRFSMGRSVSTRQTVSVVRRALHRPLKMQLLADPRGDLRAAYDEGVGIKQEIGGIEDLVDITLKTTEIKVDYAKSKMRNFDIVHYAGHAEHDVARPEESGWLLKDGRLSAREIGNMAGARPMPALVFSNACQTGQTGEWKLNEDYGVRIFGLANAFLLTGVQHYIGTFWEIPDETGAHFARSFYRHLTAGAAIGEAVRLARHDLIQKYGEDTIVWSSYMLYGDPTTRYISAESEMSDEPVSDTVKRELVAGGVRGSSEEVSVTVGSGSRRTLVLAGAGALVAAGAVAAFLFLGKGGGMGTGPSVPQAAAPAAMVAGDSGSSKRIDELVASLAEQYRSGKAASMPSNRDAWSSRPLTMVFLDIKADGAGGAAAARKLIDRITQSLQESGSVQLVEREILDKLLAELKLSSSDLADPATALRIGKLLSARVMVTGGIMPEKKGATVTLRLIDTETSAVKKVFMEESPTAEIDRDLSRKIAESMKEWAQSEYPLRGRVTSLAGNTCMLNIGQAHGLRKGDRLEIVREARKGSGLYAVTGEIEVSLPSKDSAEGRIVSKLETVKAGAQVRMKL